MLKNIKEVHCVFVHWSGNTGGSRCVFSTRFFRKRLSALLHRIPFEIKWFLTVEMFAIPVHPGVPVYWRYRLTFFLEKEIEMNFIPYPMVKADVTGFHTGYPAGRYAPEALCF